MAIVARVASSVGIRYSWTEFKTGSGSLHPGPLDTLTATPPLKPLSSL